MGEFYYVKVTNAQTETWELRHKYSDACVTDVIGHLYNQQVVEAITEFLNQREKKHQEDVKAKRNTT